MEIWGLGEEILEKSISFWQIFGKMKIWKNYCNFVV